MLLVEKRSSRVITEFILDVFASLMGQRIEDEWNVGYGGKEVLFHGDSYISPSC